METKKEWCSDLCIQKYIHVSRKSNVQTTYSPSVKIVLVAHIDRNIKSTVDPIKSIQLQLHQTLIKMYI